jgi:hypothetical protein
MPRSCSNCAVLLVATIVLIRMFLPAIRGEAGGWTKALIALGLTVVILAIIFLRARRRGGIDAVLARAGMPITQDAMRQWQENWEREREERRIEKERRREARRLGDRRFHCRELPGADTDRRQTPIDEDKLTRLGLPVLRTEREVADWLGVSLPRLRWFTFHRPVDGTSHYVRYTIPKRSGGRRVILAPKRDLKRLQRKVLRDLLSRIPNCDCCHGFAQQRSIATNAAPHVGKQVVLNLDLKDFFPTVTYARVRGMYMALGYPFAVASTLALLCTECEREPFDKRQERVYVSVGPRCLIQGAPTSPALANMVAFRLDRRLQGLAASHGFAYTRYADDLTFSGDDPETALRIMTAAGYIITDEGFTVNRDKTHLYGRSTAQRVTGLVVNDQVSTPRELRRRLRAIIHNAKTTGLQAQNHQGHRDFRRHLEGQISFIHGVAPEQAEALREALAAVPE